MTLGTIFRYKEVFYVYLLQTDEFIYAAKIINVEDTKALIRSRDRQLKDSRRGVGGPVFCFVVLTSTHGFKDQAAHYGKPEVNADGSIDVIAQLDEKDIEKLKREIMDDTSANLSLRETFKKLFSDSGTN